MSKCTCDETMNALIKKYNDVKEDKVLVDTTELRHFCAEIGIVNRMYNRQAEQLSLLYKSIEEMPPLNEHCKFGEESREDILRCLNDLITPVYCPRCGSCGEAGCCPPDMCHSVAGSYCETNMESYEELLKENQELCDELENKNKQIENIMKCNPYYKPE